MYTVNIDIIGKLNNILMLRCVTRKDKVTIAIVFDPYNKYV